MDGTNHAFVQGTASYFQEEIVHQKNDAMMAGAISFKEEIVQQENDTVMIAAISSPDDDLSLAVVTSLDGTIEPAHPIDPRNSDKTELGPMHSGFMSKRGHINRAWATRFFSIHGRKLSYFKAQPKPSDRHGAPAGVISLENAHICATMDAPEGSFG